MKRKYIFRPRVAALGAAPILAWSPLLPAFAADLGSAPVYVANDRASDVRELLARGWDPNTRINGQPAIMQAVRDGAWAVFDVLAADPRTDVNAANPHDETPLMYLAIQGQTQRAKALMARGAQVNRLGWTPLHYAASKGQLDVAKLLLSNRAIVNAPGPDGTTPLMMAGLSGSADMVKLLLDAGADPAMRNLQGLDAAAWAHSARHETLAAELERAAAARQSQLTGQSPPAGAHPERDAAPASVPGGAAAASPANGATHPTISPPASTGPTGASPPTSQGGQPGSGGEGQPMLKGVEGVRLGTPGSGATD